jgi:hypothetical protein
LFLLFSLHLTAFETLARDNLAVLLKSDNLIINETDVLRQVSRWASVECVRQEKKNSPENLRACVGDLIYEIRLTVMTTEELDSVVKDCDLISADELAAVKAWLSPEQIKKPMIKFNLARRGSFARIFSPSLQLLSYISAVLFRFARRFLY